VRPEAAALVEQLRPHVRDPRVLDAVGAVPRECFVPEEAAAEAWANEALPIPAGQTISQPLVVARMCELLELRGDERVLDVGTGSGYHAAVLGRLAREVHGIEVREPLCAAARRALAAAGADNVRVSLGDGALGLPGAAPFDAVNVAAAVARDRLGALLDQLAAGGRLVAPVVTEGDVQVLALARRAGDGRLDWTHHERVRFVPFVG
jgi:protein-L-isoaspartate(D-aspartate) O-methyltransferase